MTLRRGSPPSTTQNGLEVEVRVDAGDEQISPSDTDCRLRKAVEAIEQVEERPSAGCSDPASRLVYALAAFLFSGDMYRRAVQGTLFSSLPVSASLKLVVRVRASTFTTENAPSWPIAPTASPFCGLRTSFAMTYSLRFRIRVTIRPRISLHHYRVMS